MIQGFIFDLDGLMVDSEWLSYRAWLRCLEFYGATMTEDQYRGLIGTSHDTTLRYIADLVGLEGIEEALQQGYQEHIGALIDQGHLKPMPGLLPLIEALHARGYRLGVASNSATSFVQRATRHIGADRYLSCLVGRDQVPNAKPAPDVYLKAARCLGVSPANCLAFEDTAIGAQAALAAGMRCVLIPSPGLEVLPPEGIEAVFPSLSDFHAALDRLLPGQPGPNGGSRERA